MKYLTVIASILLGGIFIFASAMFFWGPAPKLEFPPDSPVSHFMAAMGPTGYFSFVKVFELAGGILVLVPGTRYFGLLLLGPVIVNILATHLFIMGDGLRDPMGDTVYVCALFLLWTGRKKFAALLG
ncbi:MAG TPA: hypothetical protein VN625_09075 [Desulfuromonadaceae bacterium]|nr:hypothetical protein [Desulfuromonadaceae bacterium]